MGAKYQAIEAIDELETVTAQRDALLEAAKFSLQERILAVLAKQGAPLSSVELASKTGWHINHVRAAVKALADEKRLIKYIGPIYDLAPDERATP